MKSTTLFQKGAGRMHERGWPYARKRKCENEGIQTQLKVIGRHSPVSSSIVNYAENENVDLIEVGTRGKSGFKKLLLISWNILFCHIIYFTTAFF